jgi:Zinc knuckle
MGSLPRIFDGDRTKAEAFLTEFLGYLMLNHGVPGLESPIRQVALALMLIKGEKVDLWVKNMIDTIRRLHPVHHNVPAVWNEFEHAFRQKFVDSTGELRARNQLDKLKFKYPDIDGHIAEFEDLIVKANYNLASQEAINLFLKGFSHSRNLLDKVFTPPVPETYETMKKRMVAIVKSMQLVNSIAQNAPDFRPFQRSNQPRFPQGNQQTQGFAPRQVNSSNAPPWMRNMPVPMDTSNRARTPRQGQTRSNAAQVENPSWRQPRPRTCFNCGKEGHFQAQCKAPKKTQINSIIDEPEDMKGVQEALTPEGILDNALAMFDRMPDHMKDEFIQKYEGESQNFQGV